MRLLLVLLAVIVLAGGHVAYWDLPFCGMCKDLVGKLKGHVEGGVSGLTQFATKFCDNVPLVAEGCKSMVKDNIDRIAAELKNNVETEKICIHMQLCW
ncbi:unnamed protein product [Cylicocyclus nassatus]|uniref:Saposin B-type domain-containing protein n=1 Tax=Cylicocyclus nassatus TaxID=53992 RepID=A0AA36DUT0_CYLNA|nr:unnamed protein product [Cylicocyclus nassatus]